MNKEGGKEHSFKNFIVILESGHDFSINA